MTLFDLELVLATTQAGQPVGILPGLEVSRGVAALMVALLHCGQATYYDATGHSRMLVGAELVPGQFSLWGLLLRMVGNGHGAVIFFFVLSGFVLTLMMRRAPQDIATSARYFFVGRIFRLYPAVVVTILIFAGLFWSTGLGLASPARYAPLNVLYNALLLRADIDGVMWSLQLELIAAPLIFLAYWGWQRWGAGPLIIAHVALVALSFAPSWQRVFGSNGTQAPLYAFTAGMIACLYARPLVDRMRPAWWWLVVALAGFALSRPLFGWWTAWAVVFETLFASGIVALIAYGAFVQRRNATFAAVMRYYGRISYSFYLLHPLSLILLWNIKEPLTAAVSAGVPPSLLSLMLFVGSTSAVTPLAHLQNKFVERPAIVFGHALQYRRRAVLAVY